MRTYLERLTPGARFRLAGEPEITGELLSITVPPRLMMVANRGSCVFVNGALPRKDQQ